MFSPWPGSHSAATPEVRMAKNRGSKLHFTPDGLELAREIEEAMEKNRHRGGSEQVIAGGTPQLGKKKESRARSTTVARHAR